MSGVWGTLSLGFLAVPSLADEARHRARRPLLRRRLPPARRAGARARRPSERSPSRASFAVLWIFKHTVGIRAEPEVETAGLDVSEHGMWGYPEFYIPVPGGYGTESHGHLGPAHAQSPAHVHAAVAAPTPPPPAAPAIEPTADRRPCPGDCPGDMAPRSQCGRGARVADVAPGLWIWRVEHPDWRPGLDVGSVRHHVDECAEVAACRTVPLTSAGSAVASHAATTRAADLVHVRRPRAGAVRSVGDFPASRDRWSRPTSYRLTWRRSRAPRAAPARRLDLAAARSVWFPRCARCSSFRSST